MWLATDVSGQPLVTTCKGKVDQTEIRGPLRCDWYALLQPW